jgi:hypothetical protein
MLACDGNTPDSLHPARPPAAALSSWRRPRLHGEGAGQGGLPGRPDQVVVELKCDCGIVQACDRYGVIIKQHWQKIISILIRNTVMPAAIRTTLRSCIPIGGADHRKPGAMMSIIPLEFQRRTERRWAIRFSRPTEAVAPRNHRPELESQQFAVSDKPDEEIQKIEPAGSVPLSAV